MEGIGRFGATRASLRWRRRATTRRPGNPHPNCNPWPEHYPQTVASRGRRWGSPVGSGERGERYHVKHRRGWLAFTTWDVERARSWIARFDARMYDDKTLQRDDLYIFDTLTGREVPDVLGALLMRTQHKETTMEKDSTLTVQALTEALRHRYNGISYMSRNAPGIAAFCYSWLREHTAGNEADRG